MAARSHRPFGRYTLPIRPAAGYHRHPTFDTPRAIMETATRCPACRARIAANVAVCPACGARLKRSKKAATSEGSREAPADPRLKQPKKKKRKQERSGPNYPLIGAIG